MITVKVILKRQLKFANSSDGWVQHARGLRVGQLVGEGLGVVKKRVRKKEQGGVG